MSRIGRMPISIPENVTISIEGNTVAVKGPKGELTFVVPVGLTAKKTDAGLEVIPSRSKNSAMFGLSRALLANIVRGVVDGYQKRLELVGTGYRATQEGEKITLHLGFSHPIEFVPPQGISFKVESGNKLMVSGIDKQKVGQVASEIRSLKPPEPYKGKGIRYEHEVVRRKAGKAAKVGLASGGGAS